MSSDRTNLSELGYVFADDRQTTPQRVVGVAPRFWRPGDTYEQALARQKASFDRIAAKMRGERDGNP